MLNKMGWIYLVLFLFFIREFSDLQINLNNQHLNPARLFIGSFLLLIISGTFLLLLPKATHSGITAIDALFTATSAVCVTGLIVVDTGTYFTVFGQGIIAGLIQLGGLGIMTFASYFSYFFRGKTSYENQLFLSNINNSEKIGEVFSVLKKILILTFGIEFMGAILIFFSVRSRLFNSFSDQFFFSVFHSISGFCNAGFSTLQNSLYEPGFRFNYSLHLIIAALFILGGIGFPILFNLYTYLKYNLSRKFQKITTLNQMHYTPWILNLNSRIVLSTTAILLLGGSVLFYFFEVDNTLAEHSGFGKIVTSFFGAATPRTAGFNSVDSSALHFSTILVIFLLMWIGASPASTGGGIKTSTFAIAILNFLSIAKGKDRMEVFKREIAQVSINRSFAIIALSLMVIGTAIFLIASFNSEMNLLNIAFEVFSAYSTVGLSLGITAQFSTASKAVLILTMFIGRVSMLTLLIAVMRRVKNLNYRYPSEEILIN
ncbi:ATPase [Antarcticibacterium arcticum]|uniref:ATPase n=2 Tax=Antarcticibacterium arcticum TaxID=2585771 RepID=A0A5B8YMB3_9FLAO|nr:ATPase [Antarcticibacterium arcticum]